MRMVPPDGTQWHTAGDRIQTLLDASAAAGPAARERAEQLVREVTDLYGAALERMLRLAAAAEPALTDAFAADDLVASLLLVHGLHPHSIEQRITAALDSVRPYLGSHGGDVHLLEIDDDTVRLRFSGSCKSCPSSAVTLELAVQDAVRAAAPEIAEIEVVAADADSVIPADSLLSRVRSNGHRARWLPVPDLAELAPGEVGGFKVDDSVLLACRVRPGDLSGSAGGDLFAYRDRCANCTGSMAGAQLHDTTLRCPRCGAAFDVVHAGVRVDGEGDAGLEPVPMLVRSGVPSIARAEVVA